LDVPLCPGVLLAGRPVPATATVLPDEVAHGVDVFLHTSIRFLLSGGGVLRIGGRGVTERFLYEVVGIGLSRLRRMHVSAEVCGNVLNGAEWPERPGADVVVVAEAPVYGVEPPWHGVEQLDVLLGHSEDWKAIEAAPDWTVEVEDEATVSRRLAPEMDKIERVMREGGDPGRALLLNANSMDAPGGLPLDGFVAVAPGWWSIGCGQWLARDVVGEVNAGDPPAALASRWERVRELRAGRLGR
jgi:hypothetical protein